MNGDKPRLGFVGTGAMGTRMARRFLDAGYPLSVFNRTRLHANVLVGDGAYWAEPARSLAFDRDFILISLRDDEAVRQTVLGEGGVLEGARPGSVVIDLSTVAPATSRELGRACADRGVAFLDGPVSGSLPQAESGTLVLFAGGDRHAFERSRSILEVIASRLVYIGSSGEGATMKLVVNTLLGLGIQALAEAIALGEKSGLDRDVLLRVLHESSAVSPLQRLRLGNVGREEYPAMFEIRLMLKDFRLISTLAAENAVPMPATAVAEQMCAAEVAHTREREDASAVVRLMEELAGIPVPPEHRPALDHVAVP